MSASLDLTLAALADPHRRQVVDLLRARPHRAGELAQAVGLSAPAMSRHLRALRQSGLIAESHPAFDARVRVYALQAGPIDELKAWLDAAEEHWVDQLSALKAHVEGS
jgi:DNA-binding transcriptional ArsR family regulator